MFCTLFARYMPAISRAPSRPRSRSVAWIDETIVQPTSTDAGSRPARSAPIRTFSQVYSTKPGVVIEGVSSPSPISPPSCCMRGAVPATYTGTSQRGTCASGERAGMWAEKTSPSYSKRSPPRMPRMIATESRMWASGFVSCTEPPCFVLLRKIFDVPKPAMKRPGPAASCTSRASIADCTGWRV